MIALGLPQQLAKEVEEIDSSAASQPDSPGHHRPSSFDSRGPPQAPPFGQQKPQNKAGRVFVSHNNYAEYTVFQIFSEQKHMLSKVLQFVVKIGVVQHLSEGVGLSLSSRSKFATLISFLVKPNQDLLSSNISTLLQIIEPSHLRKCNQIADLGYLTSQYHRLNNK